MTWVIIILAYFIPTIIAGLREKRQRGAIAALNLLLGWTIIGWIAALIWAVAKDESKVR